MEEERQLCPDGACVGVIGDDGRCKVCGLAAGEAPPAVIVRASHDFSPFVKRKRPRGLTVLAVINFFFAARSGLGLIGTLASPGPLGGRLAADAAPPVVASFLAVGGLGLILEVIAGLGWLRLHRVSGFVIANIWGGVALAQAMLAFAILHNGIVFVGCAYPAIALTLINTVYRRFLGPPAMTVLATPATETAPSHGVQ